MSQNDNVEELDTTVTEEDVATSTDDNEEDNTTSDDEITWEEIHRLRKAEESLKKANKKIAMLEKGVKKAPETTTINPANLSEDELDALLEKRDFYKSNTQAKAMRDEIESMVTASK
jgi:predicted phosphohydrolase